MDKAAYLASLQTRKGFDLISNVSSIEHIINKMANLSSKEYQGPSRRLQKECESLTKAYPKCLEISGSRWWVRIQEQSTVYQFTFSLKEGFPNVPPDIELLRERRHSQTPIRNLIKVENYLPAMTMLRIVGAAIANIKDIRFESSKIPELISINVPIPLETNDSVLSDMNGNGSYQAGETYSQVPLRKMEHTFLVVLKFGTDKIRLKTKDQVVDYNISQKRKSGIRNVGNSCFTNAVLQMIFNRKLIRYLLLAEQASDRRLEKLSYVLEGLQIRNQTFGVKEAIDGVEDGFRRYQEQRDAYQFLQSLLGTITQKSTFSSAVRELLEIKYREYSVCIDCGNRSETDRSYTVLDLNGVERFWSADEALRAKKQGECYKCKQRGDLLIWNYYTTAPQYLLIHPNWRSPSTRPYQWGANYTTQSIQYAYDTKLNTDKQSFQQSANQFRFNTLSLMEPNDYVLVGVISHSGGTESGHYFYFDKEREERQQWIQFNDSSVYDVNEPSGRPIIAVYEKAQSSKSVNLTLSQIQLVKRKLKKLQEGSRYSHNRSPPASYPNLLDADKYQKGGKMEIEHCNLLGSPIPPETNSSPINNMPQPPYQATYQGCQGNPSNFSLTEQPQHLTSNQPSMHSNTDRNSNHGHPISCGDRDSKRNINIQSTDTSKP